MPELLCGPDFDSLPVDPEEKAEVLCNAAELFRLFYGMVETILSWKEEAERLRRSAGGR